jgi:plastocyanin
MNNMIATRYTTKSQQTTMAPANEQKPEQRLTSIDTERRMYGRRYSGLPVDTLDEQHVSIDCTGGYMRPHMFDIQVGDTVRWQHEGRYRQGTVARVEQDGDVLTAYLEDVELLPPDYSPW